MTRIVILAAGKGTRMNSELPKVLVPLKGKPMIKYLMDEVKMSRVDPRPIIVVSPDNQDIIKTALNGYEAEYVVQSEQLGTGHAVACARSAFDNDDRKVVSIIVLYGDHPFLKSESIKKFSAVESEVLTVMPTLLPDFAGWHQNFYHWGRFVKGLDGKVQRIVEFKDASEEEKLITEVNPGFMRFNKEWLFKNIDNLANNNNSKEYYLTDMVKVAFSAGENVGTINIEPHEAMGINSLEELKIAESLLQ
jgi:bifunctional UDP-N-acetylglucosamine pyrophosphorylase/glucosamine-1-phosphate N-acetyltransferase